MPAPLNPAASCCIVMISGLGWLLATLFGLQTVVSALYVSVINNRAPLRADPWMERMGATEKIKIQLEGEIPWRWMRG